MTVISEARITSLKLDPSAGIPATPPAGYYRLYLDPTSKLLSIMDDTGATYVVAEDIPVLSELTFAEGAAPTSPVAGDFALYVDVADHHLKVKDSSGGVFDFEVVQDHDHSGAGTGGNIPASSVTGLAPVATVGTHGSLSGVSADQHHNEDHDHTAADGSGALTDDEHDGYSEYAAIATPTTPAAGKARIYAKTVTGITRWFELRDDGTEIELGAGGSASPLTTKGDLYGFDTGDARVPVGSDGQVLKADSADPLGVSWQDESAGGGAGVLAPIYYGKNSVGGASVNVTNNQQYWKKFTLTAPRLVTNIAAHMSQVNTSSSISMLAGIFSDDGAGKPADLLAQANNANGFLLGAAAQQGWLSLPMAIILPAGTYHACVEFTKASADFELTYASGTSHDWVSTAGGFYLAGDAIHPVSDSTNDWDIRVETIGGAQDSNGGLVLLEEHTASGSASLDFASCISSDYDEYLIEIDGIAPATDNVALQMLASQDGGATWDTTAGHYKWGNVGLKVGTGADVQQSASDAAFNIMVALGNAASRSVSASIRLYNPLSTSLQKLYSGTLISIITDGNLYLYTIGGAYTQTAAINALRFLMSTGNIASGTIRVYGVSKSIGAASAAYLQYQEQQASGTSAGSATAGSWYTRPLNTEVSDDGGYGVLASNQITLQPGTYELEAWAQAHGILQNKLRWQNITDATTVMVGNNAYASFSGDGDAPALMKGRFTITSAKTFELQHYPVGSKTTDGWGTNSTIAGITEIYSEVILHKVA